MSFSAACQGVAGDMLFCGIPPRSKRIVYFQNLLWANGLDIRPGSTPADLIKAVGKGNALATHADLGLVYAGQYLSRHVRELGE